MEQHISFMAETYMSPNMVVVVVVVFSLFFSTRDAFGSIQLNSTAMTQAGCGEATLSKQIIKFILLAHIFHHFALFVVQL